MDSLDERQASIDDVLTVLGATGLRLASDPRGRHLAVSRTVLHDARRPLDDTPAGLLLAPGSSPADAAPALQQAAAARFSAVAVKAYGEDTGPLARLADGLGVALLVVDDDLDWLTLGTHLGGALTASSRRGQALSAVAVGDLFALTEAIADLFGGATAVEDGGQRVLAFSGTRAEHPIDAERREGILGRQVPDTPANRAQYRLLAGSPTAHYFPADPGSHPDSYARLAVAARAGSRVLGTIWVIDHAGRLDDPTVKQTLREVADVAALHLLRAQSTEDLVRQRRAEAAGHLLDGTGDLAEAALVLGLHARGPFSVLAFAPVAAGADVPELADRLLPLVALHADSRLGASGAVVADGLVQVVAAGPRLADDGPSRRTAAEVVDAATRSLGIRVVAALGGVVSRPRDVALERRQVVRAAALLRRRPTLGPVASVGEVDDQLTLGALHAALAADPDLVPERARVVLAHDAEHGTSYAELLTTHLGGGSDVARTARRLAVHENTVRYRLRRAADLFGVALTDPEVVLPLWLGLACAESGPPSYDRA